MKCFIGTNIFFWILWIEIILLQTEMIKHDKYKYYSLMLACTRYIIKIIKM